MRVTTRLRLAIILALALPVVAGRAQGPVTPPQSTPVDAALKAVKARVAPDSRLVLFDVTAHRSGDAVVLRGEVEGAAAKDAAVAAVRQAAGTNVKDEIVVLPHATLGNETAGLIRVSVANVRGNPGHAAELVTQALMGWPVRVLKRQSGWYLVHTEPDGYLGWIEDLQLTRVTPSARDEWSAAPRVVVTSTYASAHAQPDPATAQVTDLVVADVMKSIGASGEWQHVELPDGRRAFVRDAAVMPSTAWTAARRATPDAIARTAERFMGVPYLWGGTSAKGFDCSGFAKTVLHLHGIDLPRDTDQQAKMGTAVTIDGDLTQLRTGDLLFFGPGGTGERATRVTHVGVHVGNREFIHASGLVRRNSLDPASPIYDDGLRKRLLHIRRMLPEGAITH